MIDLGQVRSKTPGCTKHVHFNNAGAALMPQPVVQAMLRHIEREVEYGGYEAENMVADQLADFYVAAAELVGAADPQEIAYSDCGTHAWQALFQSLELGPKDRIITCPGEYSSNFLSMLHSGCQVDVVPCNSKAIAESIDDSVKLIAVTHIPSQCGKIAPIRKIGEIAKAHGVRYLVDATQSIGQIPINVQEIGCDALVATGRKFLRGPRGTGFLWVSQDWMKDLRPSVVDLHSVTWNDVRSYEVVPGARRFETWEANIAAKLGLRAAIRYAIDLGGDAIWQRVQQLASYARSMLKDIPGLELCDLGETHSGLITFRMAHMDADGVVGILLACGINVGISRQNHSRLDLAPRCGDDVIRVSLHYYNTEKEIDRLLNALESRVANC